MSSFDNFVKNNRRKELLLSIVKPILRFFSHPAIIITMMFLVVLYFAYRKPLENAYCFKIQVMKIELDEERKTQSFYFYLKANEGLLREQVTQTTFYDYKNNQLHKTGSNDYCYAEINLFVLFCRIIFWAAVVISLFALMANL